ncbi:hypothetical protein BWI97_03630 [Siphonobacter sp. BAB-5405]|uniref:hypothetical protein n=1 Tax=Siphonobacter sp. BAB-5405 TaxID=1864825 RepID=UPI000C7FD492|nr:hypothetical protein [Siphonobacter sp. BAB-5405]PMD98629.1 hypothetical protein BWI97_03630 [Siphonobacter sp. BAB-5405]
MKKVYAVLFLALSVWSCKPADTEPASDYDYFPLEKGNFVIYDVTQTQYALAQDSVQSQYQIKELVADAFTGLDGESSFRLERYRRNSQQQAWAIDSVWTARRTLNQAIRTENNVPYVKLWFPVYPKQTWNGNVLNSNDPDEYEVTQKDQPLKIGSNDFSKTLTVVQENKVSAIDLVNRKEIYAKGVGLIYRERTELYYCQSAACFGQNKIDFGTRFIQQISSYGKE